MTRPIAKLTRPIEYCAGNRRYEIWWSNGGIAYTGIYDTNKKGALTKFADIWLDSYSEDLGIEVVGDNYNIINDGKWYNSNLDTKSTLQYIMAIKRGHAVIY